MSMARPGRTDIKTPSHAGEKLPANRRGPGVGESSPGCERGCLGCLGMVALALLVAAVLVVEKRNAKWNRYAEGMGELKPGMTEEEVRALFPGNYQFEAENTDDFGSRTWVPDAEAVPTRMLRVEPGAREREEAEEEEASSEEGFKAEIYFDRDGRLVGVRKNAPKGRFWRKAREIWSGGRVRGGKGQEGEEGAEGED